MKAQTNFLPNKTRYEIYEIYCRDSNSASNFASVVDQKVAKIASSLPPLKIPNSCWQNGYFSSY